MPRSAGSRRDEGKYGQYVTEKYRRQQGCSVGRMQWDFYHGLLGRAAYRQRPGLSFQARHTDG